MDHPNVVNRFPIALTQPSPEDQGFRVFTVQEEWYLEAPDCLEIEELRLGGHTMPPYEDHKYPIDGTHQNFNEARIPNYTLVQGPNGNPAIVRSLNSNDGRWQIGAMVAIKGRWADEKAASADGLDGKTIAQLREIAKTEFDQEWPAVGVAKKTMVEFIRERRG